jgi:hypothetical protein
MGNFPGLGKNRKVYAKIYTPLGLQLKKSNITPFDVLPTVLSSIGLIDDSRLYGLGISAFSNSETPLPDWNFILENGFNGAPPLSFLNLYK